MATKIHMEALSPTMEEGQIVRWLKSEGDAVSNGDILAEVETDKATMELVARGDGVLRAVFLQEGEAAPVGDVIGVIAAEDEDISDLVPAGTGGGETDGADAAGAGEAPDEGGGEGTDQATGAGEDRPGARDEEDGAAAAGDAADAAGAAGADEGGPDGNGRVKASPLARRLAEEAGIDLGSISGSGPGGRVVKKDVEEARERPGPKPAGAGAPASAPAPASGDERPPRPAPEPWSDAGAEESVEEVRVSQMRKTIARRLTESLSPVPHFFLTVEVDMGRVLESRKSMNQLVKDDGDRISVNDFVLKATAAALRKHPECNAAWHDDHIKRFGHVHLGVAVAVDDGLITPVVRHAHRKGLVQISREVREMAGRARQKKLQPEEYTGATFSISNLGMFGIREFTAIINPPEAGILAVGAVEEIPVVEDGEVVVRPRMRVTMSCDHRAIDGAQGSRFLATFREMLEEPAAILL